jgi:hypothetical protein
MSNSKSIGATQHELARSPGSRLGAIGYFGAFVVAFSVLSLFADHNSMRVRTSYTKKRAALETRAGKLEVLVTGPSGALHGVDPARFHADALNLADVSQSIYYDTAIIESQLPKLKRLQLVILVLGLFSMEMNLDDSPEYWRQFFYLHDWQIPLEGHGHLLDPRRCFAFLMYPPSTRLSVALGGNPDLAPEIDSNGFVPLRSKATNITLENARERAEYHAKIMRPDLIPSNEGHLSRLLGDLQQRAIGGAIVILPVHPLYMASFDRDARSREHVVLQRLATRYGATFQDYSADARFKSEDFDDTDHLNAAGSEKISRILDKELVQPVRGSVERAASEAAQ